MLNINQNLDINNSLKCPNKCYTQQQPHYVQGNKLVCSNCGYNIKSDSLETEKMYIKNTSNFQEQTEVQKRQKKVQYFVKSFGQQYEPLTKNEVMEIEKYVEGYVLRFKTKNIKTLALVSYYRYCELYKTEILEYDPQRSVLSNKKKFVDDFQVKINIFNKIYRKIIEIEQIEKQNFSTLNNNNIHQNQKLHYKNNFKIDEEFDQYSTNSSEGTINLNSNSNNNNNFDLINQQQNNINNNNTNNNDYLFKSAQNTLKSNKQKVDQSFQGTSDLIFSLIQPYLLQNYFKFVDNFLLPNKNQQSQQLQPNNLGFINLQSQNQHQNPLNIDNLFQNANNTQKKQNNGNLNNNNFMQNNQQKSFETEFKQKFLNIVKEIFYCEPLILTKQGKKLNNLITSVSYIALQALKICIPKKKYAEITNITYSTLVRESKEIEIKLSEEYERYNNIQKQIKEGIQIQEDEQQLQIPQVVYDYYQDLQQNKKIQLQTDLTITSRKSDCDSSTNYQTKIEDIPSFQQVQNNIIPINNQHPLFINNNNKSLTKLNN